MLGGIVQGLFGTGGPMLIAHVRERCPDRAQFRACSVAVLFVTNLIRVVLSSRAELFSPEISRLATVSLPGFLAALVAGQRLSAKLDARLFEIVVLVLLVVSGCALVLK